MESIPHLSYAFMLERGREQGTEVQVLRSTPACPTEVSALTCSWATYLKSSWSHYLQQPARCSVFYNSKHDTENLTNLGDISKYCFSTFFFFWWLLCTKISDIRRQVKKNNILQISAVKFLQSVLSIVTQVLFVLTLMLMFKVVMHMICTKATKRTTNTCNLIEDFKQAL